MSGVLAVIPCLNEAAHLEALLDQVLSDQDIDRLVVADGGSTDGSRAIVERRAADCDRLRLLDNPERIQSAGINRAVARHGVGFEWLVRVDAHCRYPNSYAQNLLESARQYAASSVVVPMFTVGLNGFQHAAAAAQNSVIGTGGSPHRHLGGGRFVEHGHHALIRLDLFRAVGGYCEALACNEDAELDHRLISAGGRIWLEPACAITYFPRSTPSDLWRQYFRYGAGRARTMRRHRMRPRLRQLVPLAVPLSIGVLPLGLIHPLFVLPAFAWGSLILTAGAVVGLRAGGGWALLAGVAAGIMQAGWGTGFLRQFLSDGGSDAPRYGFHSDGSPVWQTKPVPTCCAKP